MECASSNKLILVINYDILKMLIKPRFNKPLLVIYFLSAYIIVLVIRSVFFTNKSTPTTIPIIPEKLLKSRKSLSKTKSDTKSSQLLSNLPNNFIKQNIL